MCARQWPKKQKHGLPQGGASGVGWVGEREGEEGGGGGINLI